MGKRYCPPLRRAPGRGPVRGWDEGRFFNRVQGLQPRRRDTGTYCVGLSKTQETKPKKRPNGLEKKKK